MENATEAKNISEADPTNSQYDETLINLVEEASKILITLRHLSIDTVETIGRSKTCDLKFYFAYKLTI